MSEKSIREYLGSVERQLADDGCAPRWEDWAGVPVLIGRRADFRMRWMATNLHLFTVVAAVPHITPEVISTYTTQVLTYARKNKGGLPVGLQTGVAAFPVLVSDRVDPAAMAWAEGGQRTEFACIARPVVVDTTHQYVGFFRGKPAIGYVYASHFIDKGSRYFLQHLGEPVG